MSLSGDLITITAGTLVLLGISGSALVTSKTKSEADAAADKRAQKLREDATTAPPEAKADADGAVKEALAIAAAAQAKSIAADAVAEASKRRGRRRS